MNLLNVFKVKDKYSMPHLVYQYSFSTFNFEQVYVSSMCKASHNVLKTQKASYLLCIKSCKVCFIQWFITAPNKNKFWTNDHAINEQMNKSTYYGHNLNICFSSKFAPGIPSALSLFRFVFWSTLSSLFPRGLIFFCCIKPKTYLNHWNSETNW